MLGEKEIRVLNQLEEDISYENYFFKKVRDVKWFIPLKDKDYFKPDKAPEPIPSDDKGFYTIPEWNVLPYLERVSEQVKEEGNEKYADELLKIIHDVTEYHISHDRQLDNYRTWWYFIKILCNLPNEKISLKTIELIKEWLGSEFVVSLPGAEIVKKLLPKFLDSNDHKDWKKAEKIVEIITDVKWKELPKQEADFHDKTKKAETAVESYWLLEFFKTNAQKVGEKCSQEILLTIADRLKDVLRRKRGNYWVDLDMGNEQFRIEATHLEENNFQVNIKRIEKETQSSEESEFLFIKGEEKIRDEETIMKFSLEACDSEKKFVNGIKERLIQEDIFPGVVDSLDEKLKECYRGVYYDYSYIWFPSLWDDGRRNIHDTKQTLTVILRDLLKAKAKVHPKDTKKILKKFLGNDYPYQIFKRMVLFVAGCEWDSYKEFFWNMIEKKKAGEILDEAVYDAEVYMLLKNNVSRFTEKEKEKIKTVINQGPLKYLPEENKEKYIASWKQKWFSALKVDPFFKPYYEEQKKKTKAKEDLSFMEGSRMRSGSGPSPLTLEEVITMPNERLADYLATFRTKDVWNGPSARGLGDVLRASAKENPGKFLHDAKAFMKTGYVYIYDILWGIKDAWNEKKEIDWQALFRFVRAYVDRDEFWKGEFKIEDPDWPASNADHERVVGAVADLMEDGLRDDSRGMPETCLDDALVILLLFLERLETENEKEIKDFVTYTLNTSMGKTITALILAYRKIKLGEEKGGREKSPWGAKIIEKLDDILEKGIVEGYTLVGKYMPILYYFDKKWLLKKIEDFESLKKGNPLIEAFLDGYLSLGVVYDDLYKLMRPFYEKYLDYHFGEEHTGERLIQHIAIGYLRGHERIDDAKSLFRKVLDRKDPSQLQEIVGFFWMQRGDLKPEIPKQRAMREKIIEFWKWVYEEQFAGREEFEKDERVVLSHLAKLTIFLENIDDENEKWLMLSAGYVHDGFTSPFFIECLDRFEDNDSLHRIGRIYLKMLSAFTPDYDQKHIRSIVEKLYQADDQDNANKICNIYGSRDYEFLRDLYEKYNG